MKILSKLAFIAISIIIFSIAIKTAYLRHQHNTTKTFAGSDIEAIWKEGGRVCNLENPYSRINKKKKRIYKPPTYFPGFYISSCLMQKIAGSPQRGLYLWSAINSIIYLMIGLFFYLIFLKKSYFFLAILTASICFFSRWSMHTLASLQTNFIGILPLVLSFYFIKLKPRTSLVLFGISLLFKQIAIFLVPLFLLKDFKLNTKIIKNAFYIAVIPTLIILPFIINDFTGFMKSILYSGMRESKGAAILADSTKIMIMYALMLYTYFWYYTKKVRLAVASLVIFICFVSLNQILFTQYYLWLLMILLMALYEVSDSLFKKNE